MSIIWTDNVLWPLNSLGFCYRKRRKNKKRDGIFNNNNIFFLCLDWNRVLLSSHHRCRSPYMQNMQSIVFHFRSFSRLYTTNIHCAHFIQNHILYIEQKKHFLFQFGGHSKNKKEKKKRVNLTSNWLCVGASDVIFSFAYNHESESVALF